MEDQGSMDSWKVSVGVERMVSLSVSNRHAQFTTFCPVTRNRTSRGDARDDGHCHILIDDAYTRTHTKYGIFAISSVLRVCGVRKVVWPHNFYFTDDVRNNDARCTSNLTTSYDY